MRVRNRCAETHGQRLAVDDTLQTYRFISSDLGTTADWLPFSMLLAWYTFGWGDPWANVINVQVSSLRPREDAERLMGLERKMAEQDAADLHAKSVSGGDATPGKNDEVWRLPWLFWGPHSTGQRSKCSTLTAFEAFVSRSRSTCPIWICSKNCRLSTFVDFLQPKSCSLRHLQETDLARLSRAVRERGSPAKREQCLVTAVKVYICLHEFIPSWPKMDVEYLILNLNIWQVPTTNIALNKPDLRWSVLVEFQPRCWQGPCWLPIGVRSWDEFQGYCWSILIWALSHIRSKSEFQQATKYQQSTLGTPMLIHILCPFCWQPTDYGQLRSLCPRLRSLTQQETAA